VHRLGLFDAGVGAVHRALAVALLLVGCGSGDDASSPQAEDLQVDSARFDPNLLVDTPSFTNEHALGEPEVQTFLEHTPYGRPSFLATYTVRGVYASWIIVATAHRYRLSPRVFLVRAEMEQGLVGEPRYPSPSTRVEYAFGCGCTGVGACDPDMAGFDRQVDCLGQRLRASLDEIAERGATAGGWGPGAPCAPRSACVTLDGEKIAPSNDVTAALYQYTPRVGRGTGGNWLFWAVWQKLDFTSSRRRR
jgi:hypothetical protein